MLRVADAVLPVPRMRKLGVMATVTPAGTPETDNEIGPVNPFREER